MPNLILIKHAAPVKDPARPSREWKLSDSGKLQAIRMAQTLCAADGLRFDLVVTSDEPKAEETGQILAAESGRELEIAEDLHEHDRSNVPMLPTRDFVSSMAQFFREPDRLVLGRETAAAASARIRRAIDAVVARHAGKHIAIVTHGTVLALFAGEFVKEDPFQLWRRMGLPSFVALDWPAGTVIRIVDNLEQAP